MVEHSPVHPCVCGEHMRRCIGFAHARGSSPRVRGTLVPFLMFLRKVRFIPACAGNTRTVPSERWPRTVHPRVCGEHKSFIAAHFPSIGSSPRVRGTPNRLPLLQGGRRFIPACAGNTTLSAAPTGSRPVHPRVCGDTVRVWRTSIKSSVHPRVCGEHNEHRLRVRGVAGSSPRVRGTRLRPAVRVLERRFIPACAGNTSSASSPGPRTAVHPRVCGEHVIHGRPFWGAPGSSPRVRGTHRDPEGHTPLSRFIPACAGNTPGSRRAHSAIAVHPRVCGEHCPVNKRVQGRNGSSPRVRGTPAHWPSVATCFRFIPACAGNTCLNC